MNTTSQNRISFIESKNFKIKGRYIYKVSSKGFQKVVGQLNENNFFFYSSNCYPFNEGLNYFDTEIKDEHYFDYVTELKKTETTDFNVSFEEYIKATVTQSKFTAFLENKITKTINQPCLNFYDVRGVGNGYMEGATSFPFFDFEGKFITAQLIKYNSEGKRLKTKYSTNWFHSYEPIKQSLHLKENYKVPIKCFFGEHYLNGSDNIVAIVEAPKTAVILKELYPNIDWIATAGKTQIFSKNLNILKGKKVVIFPDAQCDEWKNFALKNNYYCSTILENNGVSAGDDVADYIFNVDSPVYFKLVEQLAQLNRNIIPKKGIESTGLNFKIVKKKCNYFTILPTTYNGKNLLLRIDNSKEFKVLYKNNLFKIYQKEKIEGKFKGFELYNSQVDWHKEIATKGGFRQMNEAEFLKELEGSFRILKSLNPNNYLTVFNGNLIRFNDSNFSVNTNYIENVLVPIWDTTKADLSKWVKNRVWNYTGGTQLKRDEFVKELNNAKFSSKLKMHLQGFNDALNENRFIDIETDLGIDKNHFTFSKIKELVKDWNENVIGCKTLKSYINKEKIDNCTKSHTLHINDAIYTVGKNVQLINNLSELSKKTGIKNRETLKTFLNFKGCDATAENVKNEVWYLLENIDKIELIRENNRIVDFKIKKEVQKKILPLKLWENVFVSFESLTGKTSDDVTLNKVIKQEREYIYKINLLNSYTPSERAEILKDYNLRLDYFEMIA